MNLFKKSLFYLIVILFSIPSITSCDNPNESCLDLFNQNKFEESFDHCQIATSNNDNLSKYYFAILNTFYLSNHAPDYKKSISLLLEIVNDTNVEASNFLTNLYIKDKNLFSDYDPQTIINFLNISAKKHNINAEKTLSNFYLSYYFDKKNINYLEKSYFWALSAIYDGDTSYNNNINKIEIFELSPEKQMLIKQKVIEFHKKDTKNIGKENENN